MVRSQIEKAAKTTAGIFKVNQHDLTQILLPIPPTTEQHRIVDRIDRAMSAGDSVRQNCQYDLARLSSLRQSILKWAFEGKLVDQDPNDEPASILLERIRKEREAAVPTKRKRRAKKATA